MSVQQIGKESDGHKQKSENVLSAKVLEMSFLVSTFHHAESHSVVPILKGL